MADLSKEEWFFHKGYEYWFFTSDRNFNGTPTNTPTHTPHAQVLQQFSLVEEIWFGSSKKQMSRESRMVRD